jgi:hypothetical protein
VNGTSYTQKAAVTNDPRSPATAADVRAQYALMRKLNDGVKTAWDAYQQVESTRAALKSRMPSDTASDAAKAIKTFRAKVDTVGGNAGIGGGAPGRRPPPSFYAVHSRLIGQLTSQDNGDQLPGEPMLDAYAAACRDMKTAAASWTAINGKDLATLNAALARSGAQPVPAAAGVKSPDCGAKPAQSLPSARNK